jgi:phosphatidylglycerol:prolipoprotein diacylglycerol transferase
MRPILFHIGSFPIHSFGVMMVIAFFSALWLVRKRSAAYGFSPNEIADVALYALIAGVLGARIVFILQELPEYLKHPNELLTLQFQGLTSFGGLFFGMAVLIVWAVRKKKSIMRLLDLCAPAFVLGHAIGRIGCLLNGCCYGNSCPDTFPLGVHVEGSQFLHYPAQAYDSLMNLAALGILLWIERRRPRFGFTASESLIHGTVKEAPRAGLITGLALILHGLARFVYEFWRAGASSTYWGSLPITQAQAMALGLVLGGLIIVGFATVSRRQEAKTA